MTAFLLVFSVFVNAPLLGMANFNLHAEPVEGAVVLPRPPGAAHDVPPDGRRRDHPRHRPLRPDAGAGYIDKNPSNKPEDRKFAIALMTMFLMFWAVLVIIGSFFRGDGLQLHLPVAPGRPRDLRPVRSSDR